MYSFPQLSNKIIHIVCIPLIMATMLALTTYIPWHTTIAGHQIGAFHIAVAVSLIYYATIGLGAAVRVLLDVGDHGSSDWVGHSSLELDVRGL